MAFPTETVYGLGANGLNPTAVARIFEVKQRPSFDPLILHVSSVDMLSGLLFQPADPLVQKLADTFWPGPLTIVTAKSGVVPDVVTSGLPTVAVRMPSHPMALELIRQAGVPVAAPSANLFGRLSPTRASHVASQLKGVDYLLEGGKTTHGVESTIVAFTGHSARLLRPGAITLEQLKKVVPHITWQPGAHEEEIEAPGQLNSHYAPEKPLHIVQSLPDTLPPGAAYLAISMDEVFRQFAGPKKCLSDNGNLIEVAANLFEALHEMENNEEVKCIFIPQVNETGIGVAIMDRLRKAAFKYS